MSPQCKREFQPRQPFWSVPCVQSPASRTLQSPGKRTPARGGSVTLARTQVLPQSVHSPSTPIFAHLFARTPVHSSRSQSPSLTQTYVVSKSVPDSHGARMCKISPGIHGSLSLPIPSKNGSLSVPVANSSYRSSRDSPGRHRATSEIHASSFRAPAGRQRSKEADHGPPRATSDAPASPSRIPVRRQPSKEVASTSRIPVRRQPSKEVVSVAVGTSPFLRTTQFMNSENSPSSPSRPCRGRAAVWTAGPPSPVAASPGIPQQAGFSNGQAASRSLSSSPRMREANDEPQMQSWLLQAHQTMQVSDRELPSKAPILRPFTSNLLQASPLNKLSPQEEAESACGRRVPAGFGELLPAGARTSFAFTAATQCNGEVTTEVAEAASMSSAGVPRIVWPGRAAVDPPFQSAGVYVPDCPPEHVDSGKRVVRRTSSISGTTTGECCSKLTSSTSTEDKIASAGGTCPSDTTACVRTEAKVMDAGNQYCSDPSMCTCTEVKILNAGDLNRVSTTEQTTRKASVECGLDTPAKPEAVSIVKHVLMAHGATKPRMDIVCTSNTAHNNIDDSCNSNGSSQETAPNLQLALRRLGFYTVEVAQSSGELGSLLHAQGKLQEAESLLRQALMIHERTLGPKHPIIAADCNKLGHLLRDRGQLQEAATFLERSFEVGEGFLEPSHQEITVRCRSLEPLKKGQSEHNRAEPVSGRDVATSQQTTRTSSDVTEVLDACNSFGQLVLRALKPAGDTLKQTAAEAKHSLYHELMPVSTEVVSPLLGPTLLPAAEPVETTMAETLLLEAESEEARALDEGDADKSSAAECAPVETVGDPCGNNAKSASLPVNGNGSLHTSLDPQDPVQRAKAALQHAIHRLGLFTVELAPISDSSSLLHPEGKPRLLWWNFCLSVCPEGKLHEAEASFRQALVICEQALDIEHPNTADDCDELGYLLRDCGQFHEAARLLRRSLEANKESPEPAHAELVDRYSNLGLLLTAQGEFKKAEPLFRHTLMILEQAGADDFDVAVACSRLGQVLTGLGKLGEAETLLRRALAIHWRGPGVSELASHLPGTSLAQQLKLCCQLEQAENLMCRALITSERLLGSQHPIVLIRCRNLGKLRTMLAQYEDVFNACAHVMEDLARSLTH